MVIQVKTIDNLRIPLTLLVIICHARIGGAIRIEDYGECPPTSIIQYDGVCNYIRCVLGWLAVPAFFVISGFLFFHSMHVWNWNVYLRKLKRRVWTLLIPYLIWLSLYTLWKSYTIHTDLLDIVNQYGIAQIYGLNWSITDNIWGLHHFEISPALLGAFWYMQQLMFMCVLSPIIYWCCKKIVYSGC